MRSTRHPLLAAGRRRSPLARPASFRVTRFIVLGALSVFAALPVYVMVSSSLKPLQDVSGAFEWVPSVFTIRPYIDIWHTVPLARYFLNSLIVSSASAGLSMAVALFAAYAVSRYRFRGRRVFTIAV